MLTQSPAFNEFGDDVVCAFGFADLIDRQDIWVIEGGCGFGFLNKTIQLIRVLAEFFIQEFDRHFPIEPGVLGQVDLAHPARADLGDDAVMRESSAGC